MKGMTEAMMKVMIALIVGGLLFVGILYILNYFGVNLFTPLCRTFCFPISGFIGSVLKSLLVGYVFGSSSMCGFCG